VINIFKKKGQNQYISWILIFGMVVGLSFLLYNWSIDQAKEQSEDLKSRTDPLICSQVGLNIIGSCQTFRSVELNVSNVNNYEIVGVLISTVGLYPEDDDYLDTKYVEYKIKPGKNEQLSILKKGTLSQIKVIPVALKGIKQIYCEDQSVTKGIGELKQC